MCTAAARSSGKRQPLEEPRRPGLKHFQQSPPGRCRPQVLLYPHLLLAALALLCSSVVRVGELAMGITLQAGAESSSVLLPAVSSLQCFLAVHPRQYECGAGGRVAGGPCYS